MIICNMSPDLHWLTSCDSLLFYDFSWLKNVLSIFSLLTLGFPQGCGDGPAFLPKSLPLMWFGKSKPEHPLPGRHLQAELSAGL